MSPEIRRAAARCCITLSLFLFAAVIVMASRHGHSPFAIVPACTAAGVLLIGGRSYLARTRRTS